MKTIPALLATVLAVSLIAAAANARTIGCGRGPDLSLFVPFRVGKTWEEIGYPNLSGDGWYVVKTVLPNAGGGRTHLLFEGVDETCKLWINGKFVAQSSGSPQMLWDKPQAADITGKYDSEAENLIVVKVHDVFMAGGLYKPVRLMLERSIK